jgi:sugar phosphate isomerase/epimerase
MLNRRNFLKNTSLLAAGSVLAGKATGVNATNVPKISGAKATKNFGLQIYSLTVSPRDREFVDNVPAGLKRVAQMGYTSIELAGYNAEGRIGAVPMAEFKKYSDDAGLKIVSSHLNPPANVYTTENFDTIKEFWKKAADHHAAIGCKYIIQPGQPRTVSTEEVAFVGEVFNEAGKIAKEAGLIFGYHNHSGEFARVVPGGTEILPVRLGGGGFGRVPEGSKMVYDGMMEATDPSLVIFELDVYWAVMGMQDPVAYMKKYANRIRVLHIKDVTVLGESGMMNFQKIFETAYSNNIVHFIVELENSPIGTQFEGVKSCADYLLYAPFVR